MPNDDLGLNVGRAGYISLEGLADLLGRGKKPVEIDSDGGDISWSPLDEPSAHPFQQHFLVR